MDPGYYLGHQKKGCLTFSYDFWRAAHDKSEAFIRGPGKQGVFCGSLLCLSVVVLLGWLLFVFCFLRQGPNM